jgi:lysophospholipase L1-like esterase
MARFGISFIAIIKTLWNKIIVLVLGVLASLIALEVFLWAAGVVFSHEEREDLAGKKGKQGSSGFWGLADRNKYDPICYFLPRGGFFRGPKGRIDRPLKKEEHTIRVMCIGDSATYSIAVDYYHSWVYLLGTKLSKQYPEKKIEVLNAGIPGTCPKQIKRIFQLHLAEYRSDILIWRESTNLSDTYSVDTTLDFARFVLDPFLYKLRMFRLFCVFADSFKKPGDMTTADRIYDFITGRVPRELDPSVVGFDSDFSMARKIAQDHGTKYALQAEYLSRTKDGRIRSETRSHNNEPVVKTMNAFEKNGSELPLPTNKSRVNLMTKLPDTLFVDGVHLTEKGEAITAEEISKFIVENKWIEAFH